VENTVGGLDHAERRERVGVDCAVYGDEGFAGVLAVFVCYRYSTPFYTVTTTGLISGSLSLSGVEQFPGEPPKTVSSERKKIPG
jgi:hypothetical protein